MEILDALRRCFVLAACKPSNFNPINLRTTRDRGETLRHSHQILIEVFFGKIDVDWNLYRNFERAAVA